jgi:hypothetical protein
VNPLFIVGIIVLLAASAVGAVLGANGVHLIAALGVAIGGTLAGVVLMVLGRSPQRVAAAGGEAGDKELLAKLANVKEPPGGRPAPAPAPAPQPVQVGGPVPYQLAQAHTPVPTDHMMPGDFGGEVVGEGTISQAFIPDHSAQSMPGFATIYQQIAAGVMRGFVMVVAGPDRGRGVPIKEERITIGRNPGHTLMIGDPGVSAHQCEIWVEAGTIMIGDAGSKNGTYINNARIAKQPLQNCDVIAFGSTKLLVTLGM